MLGIVLYPTVVTLVLDQSVVVVNADTLDRVEDSLPRL